MDSFENLEIYIPEEAEVETVPLVTLPRSILRRMGLNKQPGVGIRSRDLASSPEGTYISPVMIRRAGGPVISLDDKLDLQVASRRQLRAPNPLTMPFVTSNHNALKVLSDICGKTSSNNNNRCNGSSPPPLLPPHAVSRGCRLKQDCVILYRGGIYLSLKKPSQSRMVPAAPCRQPNKDAPSPAIEITSDSDDDSVGAPAMAAIEITDDESQGETNPPVNPGFHEPSSPEPLEDAWQKRAGEEHFLKRRCQVKLIRIPRQTLTRLLAKTQMDSVSLGGCFGTHKEPPENHKSKKKPVRHADVGPTADRPSHRDVDLAAASQSDGENPAEVPQRKKKKYVLQSESSSGSEGETEDMRTLALSESSQSETNAPCSEGRAMDGNNNALGGERDTGDGTDVAMEGSNHVDGENDAWGDPTVAMDADNYAGDGAMSSQPPASFSMDGDAYAGDGVISSHSPASFSADTDAGDGAMSSQSPAYFSAEPDAYAGDGAMSSQSPASFSMDGDTYAGDGAMSSQSPAYFSADGDNYAGDGVMSSQSPASFSTDGDAYAGDGEAGEGTSVAGMNAALPLPHVFTSTTTTTTAQHQNFDFDQLEREEQLARMRAKVKAREAALSSLL